MTHCCKSAKEKDRESEKFRRGGDSKDLLLIPAPLEPALPCGCSGGRCGGDLEAGLEFESSLVLQQLLLLSEPLIAIAKASVLRLELMGLFDIPPPLLLSGKFRFLSQT